MTTAPPAGTLAVDWTACRGRGACAELLPERITLDEWGYPLLSPERVGPELARHAHRAVKTCPLRALSVRA